MKARAGRVPIKVWRETATSKLFATAGSVIPTYGTGTDPTLARSTTPTLTFSGRLALTAEARMASHIGGAIEETWEILARAKPDVRPGDALEAAGMRLRVTTVEKPRGFTAGEYPLRIVAARVSDKAPATKVGIP